MTAKFNKLFFIILASVFLSSPILADDVKLDAPNIQNPVPNVYTGGQPSLNDINSLKEKGFTMVVNLRGQGEFDKFDERAAVETAGLTYISIPFKGMRGLTMANAAKLHNALEGDNGMRAGKVLLHCTIGMRAGGLLGLDSYFFHGLTKDQAIQLAVDAHMENNRDYVTKGYKDLRK
jgi:protein tyrosine phosphatase (PTP) superfamily phosphohydrolase (DUF442 family)